MPKQRLMTFIATGLIVVGLIGVLFTYKSSGAAEETMNEKVIQNPNITDISIESDNATIEVLPTTDEHITVKFAAKESKYNKYKLEIEEDGDTLSVELSEKLIQFINFNLDFDFSGPKITVYLPHKQYEKLMVDNINGKVSVKQINVETIHAKTVNGRIVMEDLNTTRTTVSSENGSIELEYVNGIITSDVVNGSTTFITDNLDRSIDLESVNGKIKVVTDQEPTNATIEVNVVNGKVDVFGNDSRNAVIGDGEHRIKLKTVNGSITISK
ncbi:DUF4097 family beta strand repeat-containing protein [Paucisalibacillus globulus]|jgi:DUF4097 and DUF4098 domain-containing protein YvlB|uniref:DUF4097 family beta strand repeat-containing protein n=1 Tax=Paucisalibacillus globulus TaxID=351095 RepID=UPI000BB91C78|nr:DUF4097 family beta strand repeat-containing protein [Paucisalibacillus globulus]